MMIRYTIGSIKIQSIIRNSYSTKYIHRMLSSSLSELIDMHPQVSTALIQNKPIVALESTVITHGMPYPKNLETALEVENIVRTEGATPATIAIIDGRIKVGLTTKQFEKLSTLGQDTAIKCSRRDLPYVLSKNLCGGTTVAGTMIIAKMVGIKIFSTGGIGGVHRDGHETFDVSADLTELGKTPIAVVSAGVKSILDIPKTLEYLETQGVCVATYKNPEKYFPAFYARSSGIKIPYNLNDSLEAAKLISSSFKLNLNSGILIAVPIPIQYAIGDKIINDAINSALIKAKEQNISGKSVTPFLLESISEITKGCSLEANIALLKNNAKIASEIATQLSKLSTTPPNIVTSSCKFHKENKKIAHEIENNECKNALQTMNKNSNVPVIIGASILDIVLKINEDDIKLNGATYRSNSFLSCGGVGRNLSEGIYKIYGENYFITAIGKDEIGIKLKSLLPKSSYIYEDKFNSSSICTVIIDKMGDCKIVIGDMRIHQSIKPDMIYANEKIISESPLVIMDANVPIETMSAILEICNKYNKPAFFQPTDMRFANKPFKYLQKNQTDTIKFISPNIYELYEICLILSTKEIMQMIPKPDNIERTKESVLKLAFKLLKLASIHFDCIILTLNEFGVAVSRYTNENDPFYDENLNYINYNINDNLIQYRYYEGLQIQNIINVSGAGDSFTSGFISGILKNKSEIYSVSLGQYAAVKALMSHSAVPENYFRNNDNNEIKICKPINLKNEIYIKQSI